MKPKVIAFTILFAIVFVGCKDECTPPEWYDDCETAMVEKFLGNYRGIMVCYSDTDSVALNVNLKPPTVNQLHFNSMFFGDLIGSMEFQIPEQPNIIAGDTVSTMAGNGSIVNGNTLNLSITTTSLLDTLNCTYHIIKF